MRTKIVKERDCYILEETVDFVLRITDVHGDNVAFSISDIRQLRNDIDVWLATRAIEERAKLEINTKQFRLQF